MLTAVHREKEEIVSGFVPECVKLVEIEIVGMFTQSCDIIVVEAEYARICPIDDRAY